MSISIITEIFTGKNLINKLSRKEKRILAKQQRKEREERRREHHRLIESRLAAKKSTNVISYKTREENLDDMLVGTPYEGIYTEFKKYKTLNKPQKNNEYEQRDADYENLWIWLGQS